MSDDAAESVGRGLDALLEVSAALGAADAPAWAAVFRDARGRGDPVRIEEAILQSYLFVGFPATINALEVWREIEPEALVTGDEADGDETARRTRGEALCRRVYGPGYEGLRRMMRRLHPTLERWMIEQGYGTGLSRGVLTPRERELCAVALLAAAGHGPQLAAHARGALNMGAAPAEVDRAVEIGVRRAERARSDPGPPAEEMHRAWRSVRPGTD